MRMLVLGAKLQGTEVIYLAKEAGYQVTVIDKNPDAPAVKLADTYVQADIVKDEKIMITCYEQADVVFPVIEDREVLERAITYGEQTDTKVIFDIDAYEISSSKLLSNALFEELGLPIPGKYPDCEYPVILKPDGASGSADVQKAYSTEEVEAYMEKYGREHVVIQEYLEGPSYSLEVIGDGEKYFYPQITEVVVDEDYDCKRINAPACVSEELAAQMYEIGRRLAEKIKIRGIFDIEVIDHHGTLKLLEIDARCPSQTPISVYHSTGINMVKMLAELFVNGDTRPEPYSEERCCIYQQIAVENGDVQVLGEHIMGSCSRLKRIRDFYGADEVITDYAFEEQQSVWKAIVIITRDTFAEAEKVLDEFLSRIRALQVEY